jgi:hypothetical protein
MKIRGEVNSMNLIEYLSYLNEGKGTMVETIMVFGVGLGFIVGLIPLITGIVAKKKKLAIMGFILAWIGTVVLGFILGAPIAVLFLWLILKPKKDALLDAEDEDEDLKYIELDESDFEEEKNK